MNFIKKSENQLIVSCQAVDDEPLNDSQVMQKMALAVVQGGAQILRLSQVEHIQAVQKVVDIPIIGLIKKHYDQSEVFITPTMKEVKELIQLRVDVIAMDATLRLRPKEDLKTMVGIIKKEYPNQLLMADCATLDDALYAQELGFNLVGTTLRGYTRETQGMSNLDNNYQFIKTLVAKINLPIIAEGGIWEPKQAKEILGLGVHAIVVGSAITRPKLIVEYWREKIFN